MQHFQAACKSNSHVGELSASGAGTPDPANWSSKLGQAKAIIHEQDQLIQTLLSSAALEDSTPFIDPAMNHSGLLDEQEAFQHEKERFEQEQCRFRQEQQTFQHKVEQLNQAIERFEVRL